MGLNSAVRHIKHHGKGALCEHLVVIAERDISNVELCSFASAGNFANVTFLDVKLVATDNSDEACADKLCETLLRADAKRINLIGIGSGASVALVLAREMSKSVRRMVIIDAEPRSEPRLLIRLMDVCDKLVPMGMPFLFSFAGFDCRFFLHSLRMPVLILTSSHASNYCKEQSKYFHRRLPNSYLRELTEWGFLGDLFCSPELLRELASFFSIQVKMPQGRVSQNQVRGPKVANEGSA